MNFVKGKRRRLKKKRLNGLLRDRRGQSMVEYAIIAACILGGLIATSIIFLPTMIRAYNIYYQSFYVILNLPIP
jgi:Flp pilus assembly pilin Flp